MKGKKKNKIHTVRIYSDVYKQISISDYYSCSLIFIMVICSSLNSDLAFVVLLCILFLQHRHVSSFGMLCLYVHPVN